MELELENGYGHRWGKDGLDSGWMWVFGATGLPTAWLVCMRPYTAWDEMDGKLEIGNWDGAVRSARSRL
ncbi:unnamed protein product [Penicillium roqueforti FM164]|uniref:Uncharacterized protein n=1 Tax=Penicillium roqueforti (strain FM164) TaxID=1365484 RepID=W6QIU9_PENRF|nr:unnamed protein product [Penicillium roqueforti FM164]